MFKKLDHVEIVTEDPDRAVAFYTDILGFQPKLLQHAKLPQGGVLHVRYLALADTGIELLTYEGVPVEAAPKAHTRGYRLMALEVDDMEAALAGLKARGIEASWGPLSIAEYVRAEIRDPDGNSIELREWKQRPF